MKGNVFWYYHIKIGYQFSSLQSSSLNVSKNNHRGLTISDRVNKCWNQISCCDFYATWCGPCQRIAPIYVELSTKYPTVVFLKVDVDQCQETGAREGISAMPTFIFYKNKTKIDTMRGADPNALEEKIKQWKGGDSEGQEDDVTVKGHLDIGSFISSKGCECLNESDEHTLEHALSTKGGYLESDCDEQLIINLEFSQNMKSSFIEALRS
ncbi:Thioredoxin-like protein 1 [Mytilus edulis]|uniref:Thioredoxin-like protein 1 n=1 Tax=Mytilus edulis TaxID=6550 RepID=A0A8S3THN4_MYTED|nr:Thioredoxin-like protein 1 [Mytilus edulis]